MKWVTLSMIAGLALAGTAQSAGAQDRFTGAPKGPAFHASQDSQVSRSHTVVLAAQEPKGEKEADGKTESNGETATKITIKSETAYDTWEDRRDLEGDVVSEVLEFQTDTENLGTSGDNLTINVKTAYVWAKTKEKGDSDSTGHTSDTQVFTQYMRPFPESKNWSGAVKLDLNLPSGLTDANRLERSIKPAKAVITKSYLGAGFDIGLGATVTKAVKNKEETKYSIGVGAKRRGSYDSTQEDPADQDGVVSSGFVYKGFAAAKSIPGGIATIDVTGTYTRTQGYGDTISNSAEIEFGVNSGLNLGETRQPPTESDLSVEKNLGLGFTYNFEFNDDQPERAVFSERDSRFQEGVDNTLKLNVDYRFGDLIETKKKWIHRWNANAALSGSFGDKDSPRDDTFSSTDWSFGVKAGLAYKINKDTSISAFVKRAISRGEEEKDGEKSDTRFSSWTWLIGASIKF